MQKEANARKRMINGNIRNWYRLQKDDIEQSWQIAEDGNIIEEIYEPIEHLKCKQLLIHMGRLARLRFVSIKGPTYLWPSEQSL